MLRICNPKLYELGICNPLTIPHKQQLDDYSFSRVINPDTHFAADNISTASQVHQLVTKMMLRICNPKQYELGICNPLNNHRVAKTLKQFDNLLFKVLGIPNGCTFSQFKLKFTIYFLVSKSSKKLQHIFDQSLTASCS